jgi:beta-alanine--pyruvate transaminase
MRAATRRARLIGRQCGYHGTNFGGLSVGGLGGNRRRFVSQVWGWITSHTQGQAVRFQRGLQPGNGALADELEDLIALHGAETIAAVIVEPMAGSAGVLAPAGLSPASARDHQHGILLIFDEVITGFGRLGAATGAELFGVTPDIITLARLTNATVPMGAVVASREVHDAIVEGSPEGIEFYHGYTIRAIRWRRQRGWPRADLSRGRLFAARARWRQVGRGPQPCRLPSCGRHPQSGPCRGIELAPRDGTPVPAQPKQKRSTRGLLIRATGDIIALSPPLIISATRSTRSSARCARCSGPGPTNAGAGCFARCRPILAGQPRGFAPFKDQC